MSNRDSIQFTEERSLNRRQLLRLAAATSVAAASVGQTGAVRAQGFIEQGDEQCRILGPLVKPTVDVTEDNLKQFIAVSQILTGEKNLSRNLAGQYLERFAWLWDPDRPADATNPGYFPKLKKLLDKYEATTTSGAAPASDDLAAKLVSDPDPDIADAAQQVIYLWYVSAFFMRSPDPKNPGTFGSGKNWLYGTTQQYEQAILWPLVKAHAPMMRGGTAFPPYWAAQPVA